MKPPRSRPGWTACPRESFGEEQTFLVDENEQRAARVSEAHERDEDSNDDDDD